MGRSYSLFCLLLWKDWKIMAAHPCALAASLIVPVMGALFIAFIRIWAKPQEMGVQHHEAFLPIKSFPLGAQEETMRDEGYRIAWAGKGGASFKKAARDVMNVYNFLGVETLEFPTEEKLYKHLTTPGTMSSKGTTVTICGVIFEDSSGSGEFCSYNLKMTLRFPGRLRFGGRLWVTDRIFDEFMGKNDGLQYITEGFTQIQAINSLSIVAHCTGPTSEYTSLANSTHNRQYPDPPAYKDMLMQSLHEILPLIVLVSFLLPFASTVKAITKEKEFQLKECMKIMGLSNALHWSAWFVKSMLFLCIIIACIVTIWKIKIKSYAVFNISDWSILFSLFFLYGMASTCLAFLVSTFFSKAHVAAIAGGLIWFGTYMPAVFLQKNIERLSLVIKITLSLFSNTAIVLGCLTILKFEAAGEGSNWDNLCLTVSPEDNITVLEIFLMLLMDSVLYFLLALYVEAVWPGPLGMPRPWNFIFTKDYWINEIREPIEGEKIELEPENFENDPEGLPIGVQIQDLRKVFPKNKVAVENVTLNFYEGQITVLLGHNGAGKSTTMSMLTGMYPPTSGTAILYGHDIIKHTNAAREHISICLQQNVLFDELSVQDHLYFYCKLKGLNKEETNQQIDKFLTNLDLRKKQKAKSSTLSGGLKRRLAIGVALCGKSKVVFLDEPTAGVDPAARHDFWSVLRQEKEGRTILLTTHFMDEADALGDRIAIMSHGRIMCCGSPFFLKKRYGAGYKLIVEKGPGCNIAALRAMLIRNVRIVGPPQDTPRDVTFQLQDEDAPRFEAMFQDLERNSNQLRVEAFGVSVATMDDVFIKTVEEGGDNELLSPQAISEQIKSNQMRPKAYTGIKLEQHRLLALCHKRWIVLKTGWAIYLVHCLIPTGLLIINKELHRLSAFTIKDPPSLDIDLKMYNPSYTTVAIAANNTNNTENPHMPFYPDWYRSYKKLARKKDSEVTDLKYKHDPISSFENFILRKIDENKKKVAEKYPVAATWGPDEVIGWFHTFPIHSIPVTNLLLINSLLLLKKMSIYLINYPVPLSEEDKKDMMMRSSKEPVSSSILLGMGFVCAYFILFPIKESACKSKHLQFISGVDAAMFWSVHCVWCVFLFLGPVLVFLIAIAAYDIVPFSTTEHIGHLFVIFMCHAWSAVNLILLLSYGFHVPATGYIISIVLYPLFGVLYSIIELIRALNKSMGLKYLQWFLLIIPPFNLVESISDFEKNSEALNTCKSRKENCDSVAEDKCCPGKCPGGECYEFQENYFAVQAPGFGKNIIAFIVSGFLWFLCLCLIAYLRVYGSCSKTKEQSISDASDDVDDDVLEEKRLIHSYSNEELQKMYTLCLKDVSKWYKKLLAVDATCIGVTRGECFGLLGANGAGKTTTFRIMTGDIRMSSGHAFVLGYDTRKAMKKVCQYVGYCPQFDALLDIMTGRETLHMFCLIRGIPLKRIPPIIKGLGDVMLFSEHMDKKVKTYSGGTRRKLSAAVALVGRPPLVFMDEPTAGMDPVARRCVWGVLRAVRDAGVSIVFTSHSMDECEALCTRIAIMVNGRFRCLGSLQHLKSKFAQGHVLQVRVRQESKQDIPAETSLPAVVSEIKQFVEKEFPGAILRDQYMGLLTYLLPKSNLLYSQMFAIMEKGKNNLKIEEYILSQTDLEQVFLTFVKEQKTIDD